MKKIGIWIQISLKMLHLLSIKIFSFRFLEKKLKMNDVIFLNTIISYVEFSNKVCKKINIYYTLRASFIQIT